MTNPRPYSMARALGLTIPALPALSPAPLGPEIEGEYRDCVCYLGPIPNAPNYHAVIRMGKVHLLYCTAGFEELSEKESVEAIDLDQSSETIQSFGWMFE